MNITNKLLIFQTALIVLLAIALYFTWRKSNENGDDLKAYQISLSNKLKTFTDENGHLVTQAQAAVFDDNKNFDAAVKAINASGGNILSKIDGKTQGLILLQKQIGGQLNGKTEIGKSDTVKIIEKTKAGKDSSSQKVYPQYTINDTTNKYYKLFGVVGYDKYQLTPTFLDSTELKPTMINGGLFKKSVLGVEELNHNPYAKTTGLKYLQVKKTPAPIWKIVGIIGVAAGGIYLGHKLQ